MRIEAAVLCGLLFAACSMAPPSAAPDLAAGHEAAEVAGFSFARDTFAFANYSRSRNPDAENLYDKRCFVLGRSLRQFFQFARFEPHLPRLEPAAYASRIRQVVARPPWREPLPAAERVVIPGYGGLRERSRAHEHVVKEALGPHRWTLLHWTNWRIVLPVGGAHQERVARRITAGVRAGRLVQLLVTDFPQLGLNHTVVAFAYEASPATIDVRVWDPNDPLQPGHLTFDRRSRRFWASALWDVPPMRVRVFQVHHSPVL